MSRHPHPDVTASQALAARMSKWAEHKEGDLYNVAAVCHAISEKVAAQINGSTNRVPVSAAALDLIFDGVERNVQSFRKEGRVPDAFFEFDQAEIVVLKLNVLMLEDRVNRLERARK